MKHYLTTIDWTREELEEILQDANALAVAPIRDDLKNKAVALLFFNSSLRTRTSFEIGVQQLGGHVVSLSPGKDAWPIEFDSGVEMLGEAEENIVEAARVLGRFVDMIGVRAFPNKGDWAKDRENRVIKAFAEHAGVPIVNMETIEHPCQELAMIKALKDRHGTLDGKKFVLTWTYHPKPLNTAVANSALMIAAKFGMDVTLLCPTEDYLLDQRYMQVAEQSASANGRSITVTHDIDAAYTGADAVYAKSWGALPFHGQPSTQSAMNDQYKHFIVNQEKMDKTNGATFSHCLPLRRNVKATDQVMDADYCIAIEEAENRLHVQKALLARLIREN